MRIRCSIAHLCLFICTLSLSISTQAALSHLNGVDVKTGVSVDFDIDKSSKGSVVVFLSSVCPCSQSHMSLLKELKTEYSDFQFIGVLSNTDEKPEIAKQVFLEMNFPIILDRQSKIADQLKALKTPHVFVLNQHAEILYQGGITDVSNAATAKKYYLKDALASIQKGEKPAIPIARALGCYIKR